MSRRTKLHDRRIILPTGEPPALLEGVVVVFVVVI